MKRRDFLQKLGIGAAACAVVPLINNTHEEQARRVIVNDTAVANMTPKQIIDFYRNHGILLTDPKHQHTNSSNLLNALNTAQHG